MERSPRRARPALLAALALAMPLSLSSLPAGAAPPSYVYDALGDSYAAGYGLPAGQAHAYQLEGRMRISLDDLAATPGASTLDLGSQLTALDGSSDLVTLSIGGNDLPWIDVVVTCGVGSDQACAFTLDSAQQAIDALGPALHAAYAQVHAAAPGAHVVVTGYPHLFSPEYGAYTGTITLPPFGPVPYDVSVTEQLQMNALVDQLNAVIAVKAAAHEFQYVDVAARFDGHGVNSSEPWIGGPTEPTQLHPNAQGQHAYGVALRAAIRPSDLK